MCLCTMHMYVVVRIHPCGVRSSAFDRRASVWERLLSACSLSFCVQVLALAHARVCGRPTRRKRSRVQGRWPLLLQTNASTFPNAPESPEKPPETGDKICVCGFCAVGRKICSFNGHRSPALCRRVRGQPLKSRLHRPVCLRAVRRLARGCCVGDVTASYGVFAQEQLLAFCVDQMLIKCCVRVVAV